MSLSINVVTDVDTDLSAAAYAERADIFRTFTSPEVDSGNVSYGARHGSRCYFLKTAGDPDASSWTLSHPERVGLLRNAVRLNRMCPTSGLPRLLNVIEASDGPVLVYDWVDGQTLGGAATQRALSTSAHQRFRALPVVQIVDALDLVIAVHTTLASAGWIAVDFYDGSLLYDFASHRMTVVDTDHYHEGPFVNVMGRMFGSERFMAPEEFVRGARIDQRTTVFTLGRLLAVFLADGTLERNAFRGSSTTYAVMVRACHPDPHARFDTVASFTDAWQTAARDARGLKSDGP